MEIGAALPFDESSVDCVSGFDFLEHLSRTPLNGASIGEFIRIMSEIHRILKPGGIFIAASPYFPEEAAFSDPTHVNFITRETHKYFTGDAHARDLGYGYAGDFIDILVEAVGTQKPFSLWALEGEERKQDLREPEQRKGYINSVLIRFWLRKKPSGHGHLLWVFQKPPS